ncbi:MAG TPA: NAD(P)-binding domain-containing protein, partial [Terriglobales bacterium]
MAAKPKIAIVGAGNLGSALARALHAAGYRITEIICREGGSQQRARRLAAQVRSRAVALQQANFAAEVVWICVPDSNLGACARELARLADWKGKIALHPSGALASDELQALRRRGAAVAAAHPMMTFVRRSSPSFAGTPFAVEGDPAAVRAARRMV